MNDLPNTIRNMINLALARKIKPNITINEVKALNKGTVEYIKQKHGIKGIAVDVDSTIKPHFKPIPDCNKEWLEMLMDDLELKITILSNGNNKDIQEFCEQNNIPYINYGMKPLKRGFKEACERMEINPSQTLMIGNSYVCDIIGGKRMGMKTAHVKSVINDDRGER